jgi:V/A-type H+-transporting ATPase subunit C
MSAIKALTHRPSGKDYGYCNARARGMRSRLLNAAYLDQLMAAADLSKVIGLLMDSEYSPELEEQLIHGHSTAAVDEALKVNMVRTFRKVMGFVNGEAEFLLATLLGRWDLFNIKTIIRGKHMKLSAEEIEESLFAVGLFSAVDLSALCREQDARAVADTLVTWAVPYSEPLRAAMPEYMRTNDLSLLELALDKYYFEWAAGRLSGKGPNARLTRKLLGVQTDAINLLTVFRLQKADVEGIDIERFFLPGGLNVSKDLFLALAPLSDVDEVVDRLKRTPYGMQLDPVVINYIEEGSISVFERALEDFVMRKALAAGRGDPLGVGIVIGYLWAKQNEITNLRIIVKGKAVGMPPDRMRKELILV